MTQAESGTAVLSREAPAGGTETWQVEIPAGTWHTLAVLSEEAVLYEVIDGHFDPGTHKRFAPWAPSEGEPGGGPGLPAGFDSIGLMPDYGRPRVPASLAVSAGIASPWPPIPGTSRKDRLPSRPDPPRPGGLPGSRRPP